MAAATIATQVIMGSNTNNTNSMNELYVANVTISNGTADVTGIINLASGDLGTSPRIVRVTGTLVGFTAQLLWDASTPVMFAALGNGQWFDFHWGGNEGTGINGLIDNAGAGKTGDIKIATNGITAVTAYGFLTFWVRKGSQKAIGAGYQGAA